MRLARIESQVAKPDAEYLDTEAAAIFTSISAVQLAEWRSRGGGPRYIKMGRKVLYARIAAIGMTAHGSGTSAFPATAHLRVSSATNVARNSTATGLWT